MSGPALILASASPRRLELLAQIGIVPAAVVTPDVDETPEQGELPRPYALRVASAKAARVAALHPDSVVLAADTVVSCGRRILPKAEDSETARRCLTLLSGRRHQVTTALAVASPTAPLRTRVSVSRLRFKCLTPAEITAYIAFGEWQGKAGGYAVQGRAGAFVMDLTGSYSGVVGLALYEASALLTAAGLAVIQPLEVRP